ncbi:Lipoate-protein ligase A [Clostridiaceae bacterium JG1575]|nr:Lipoate-protein ligase A [Clostridiaceae bacterium JG1575]
MIYVETGSTDVFFNFALEYYFTAVKELSEPVFLFWRTTPTLMVGKYQNTLEEIHQEYAQQKGIEIVRRMSGGGTIYTDLGGWQFTFIQYHDDGQIHFQKFIEPVVQALRSLGVPASFNGRNDLVIEGRKFSGNAQYKLAGHTVHHGSTLFDTDIDEMVKSTQVDPYKISSKSIKSVRDRVTNIKDHLKTPMDPLAFKKLMISSILGEPAKSYELTAEDRRAIEAIAEEHFRPWAVRFGQNPKCTLSTTGRFPGGKITFSLNVKQGIIEEAQIHGDFFATEEAAHLGALLRGCKLERQDLTQRLLASGMDDCIYGIRVQDMVDTILSPK